MLILSHQQPLTAMNHFLCSFYIFHNYTRGAVICGGKFRISHEECRVAGVLGRALGQHPSTCGIL